MDAGNAEAALDSATTAIDHLRNAWAADDALSDAVAAAEQALYDAQAAQQSPQSVIATARDAFATTITEVLSDADAYAAFREPIQESCQ